MLHALDSQREVVEFLRSSEAYGKSGLDVKVIETHAALVFLSGEGAYKIKKAVVYPYLDFSTLEKRKTACERELEINWPHAPQIYIGVVPICRSTEGDLSIDGAGAVVEWAVHMNRFSDDALLDQIIEDNRFSPQFFKSLADEITQYHATAPQIMDNKGALRIEAIIDELVAAFTSTNSTVGVLQLTKFAARMRHDLEVVRHRLTERGERGFVRRCHGDLHLQNIVVLDGEAVLFDAIEFDEELATIDVLYDLAFLIMDLEAHNLRREANIVLNRYVSHDTNIANIAGLQAFPLFLACRAGIRAMVAITRADHAESDSARAKASREASVYFASALQFLELQPPRLICIGGLSGTGKTTVAYALAPQVGNAPGALHLRSDVERKILFGVGETDRLGASAYTDNVNAQVYTRLFHKAKLALLAGRTVIVDAVFAQQDERDQVEDVAKSTGAAFEGIWLEASEQSMTDRVTQRTGDASDADAGVVQKQLASSIGLVEWHQINADGPLEATLSRCAQVLV